MAVPKKRTSKSKKNLRKTCWKNKLNGLVGIHSVRLYGRMFPGIKWTEAMKRAKQRKNLVSIKRKVRGFG